MVIGIISSGLLTWAIGRPSYHIGASGLIYVLFSFVFFKGIIAKHYRLIALSLLVVFLYGSMIWYTIPMEKGVSWEGHLSGFIVGGLLSLMYNNYMPKEKKYKWEDPNYRDGEDAFMKQFDANGYFFEIEDTIDLDEVEEEPIEYSAPNYIYHFKSNSQSESEDSL